MTFDWTVRVTDIVMVLAVLLGPIVAVQLTEWLRSSKELRERRDWVFRTLMATRNANLAPAHVEALNLVDVLFHSQRPQERRVVDTWRLYLTHLNDREYPRDSWGARRAELLLELLHEMGIALGYSFDRSHIQAGTYYPGGYSDAEIDQLDSRKLWLQVLRNERAIRLTLVPLPDEESIKQFIATGAAMRSFIAGETTIPVRIETENDATPKP